ncbi:MAG: translation initiation factor [Saprospiraceae bacterium]|nr:translation initiation factor [Saprospiraceae bacterium]MBP7679729.1 translation initiation factor [Saprospiraceae bacterium]
MSKHKKDRIGVVYSTSNNFDYSYEQQPEQDDLPPKQQQLRVQYERKNRGGKEATIITGFIGTSASLEDLGRFLKQKCGVGGSAKDGEIIVQGNLKEKIIQLLKEKGYTQTK